MQKRFILAGAPGAGKTSLATALSVHGYYVINEAATDLIKYKQLSGMSHPWQDKEAFINEIVLLQAKREQNASKEHRVLFFDRSAICTYALSQFLGAKPTKILTDEINRIVDSGVYQADVIFLKTLGFIENTEVRTISYQQALEFEALHVKAYKKFGFNCIFIEKADIITRLRQVIDALKI